MATPESKVKQSIKRWLNAQGIYSFSPIGSAFGTHGVPDIICCVRGLFVAIEVKAPGKLSNTTANQKRHIADIKKSGGVAFVVDSLDLLKELWHEYHLSVS